MNMHQVTPESIRKLRASLKLHEYKNLEDMKGVLTRFENNNLPLVGFNYIYFC